MDSRKAPPPFYSRHHPHPHHPLHSLHAPPPPPPPHHPAYGLHLLATEMRTIPKLEPLSLPPPQPPLGLQPLTNPRSALMPVPGPYKKPLSPKKSKKPEFLVKLYRMLQCEDPSVICWDNGRIHVHDPKALGQSVLAKYFRHSKYSSFQRQLNYFGFRKTQGKGKMSACTYTNFDLTNASLKSILKIKRKTNTSKQDDDLYEDSRSEGYMSSEGSITPRVNSDDRLLFLYRLATAHEDANVDEALEERKPPLPSPPPAPRRRRGPEEEEDDEEEEDYRHHYGDEDDGDDEDQVEVEV